MCCNPEAKAARRAARQTRRCARREAKHARWAARHGIAPAALAPSSAEALLPTPTSDARITAAPQRLMIETRSAQPPSYDAVITSKSSGPVDQKSPLMREYMSAATSFHDQPLIVHRAETSDTRSAEPIMVRSGDSALTGSETCRGGGHKVGHRKFGIGGIMGGIFFFPWGLFCRGKMPFVDRPHEYPLIDSDPHAGRVIRYMRSSDYATWAGATAAGPGLLYLYERVDPTRYRHGIGPALRLTGFLGFCAGFMLAYQSSTKRFWGWSENAQEVARDKAEMTAKVQAGQPVYGDTDLSDYLQGVAARNSTWSQLKLHAMPWFNIVNHNRHGVDAAEKYGAESPQRPT